MKKVKVVKKLNIFIIVVVALSALTCLPSSAYTLEYHHEGLTLFPTLIKDLTTGLGVSEGFIYRPRQDSFLYFNSTFTDNIVYPESFTIMRQNNIVNQSDGSLYFEVWEPYYWGDNRYQTSFSALPLNSYWSISVDIDAQFWGMMNGNNNYPAQTLPITSFAMAFGVDHMSGGTNQGGSLHSRYSNWLTPSKVENLSFNKVRLYFNVYFSPHIDVPQASDLLGLNNVLIKSVLFRCYVGENVSAIYGGSSNYSYFHFNNFTCSQCSESEALNASVVNAINNGFDNMSSEVTEGMLDYDREVSEGHDWSEGEDKLNEYNESSEAVEDLIDSELIDNVFSIGDLTSSLNSGIVSAGSFIDFLYDNVITYNAVIPISVCFSACAILLGLVKNR